MTEPSSELNPYVIIFPQADLSALESSSIAEKFAALKSHVAKCKQSMADVLDGVAYLNIGDETLSFVIVNITEDKAREIEAALHERNAGEIAPHIIPGEDEEPETVADELIDAPGGEAELLVSDEEDW